MNSRLSLIIIVLLALSLAANVLLLIRRPQPDVQTRTEYIPITIDRPVLTATEPIGHVSIPVSLHQPSSRPQPDTVPTVIVQPGDTTAVVSIPMQQAVYSDSLYTAWVSGYRPRLDSLHLHIPHTYTVRSQPQPRWSIGLSAGPGYGLTTHCVDFFVGATFSIILWSR